MSLALWKRRLAADCCLWSGYKSGCVPFAPLSPGCLLFSLSPTHCVSLCNTPLMEACSLRHASLFFLSLLLSSSHLSRRLMTGANPQLVHIHFRRLGAMWHCALTSCLKSCPEDTSSTSLTNSWALHISEPQHLGLDHPERKLLKCVYTTSTRKSCQTNNHTMGACSSKVSLATVKDNTDNKALKFTEISL